MKRNSVCLLGFSLKTILRRGKVGRTITERTANPSGVTRCFKAMLQSRRQEKLRNVLYDGNVSRESNSQISTTGDTRS